MKTLADSIVQPMRLSVACSAMAGPYTVDHCSLLDLFSRLVALLQASSSACDGTHLSRHAIAQCLLGKPFASKAGSKVPMLPSRVNRLRSVFFPAPAAAAALLMVARVFFSLEQATPQTS